MLFSRSIKIINKQTANGSPSSRPSRTYLFNHRFLALPSFFSVQSAFRAANEKEIPAQAQFSPKGSQIFQTAAQITLHFTHSPHTHTHTFAFSVFGLHGSTFPSRKSQRKKKRQSFRNPPNPELPLYPHLWSIKNLLCCAEPASSTFINNKYYAQ